MSIRMLWPPATMNCDNLGRLAVNRGNCELKHAVTSGNNKLWWPPATKFRQIVSENYYVMFEQFPNNLTKYGLLMKVYFNNLCDAIDNLSNFSGILVKNIYLYVFFVYLVYRL